ncbi:MAG: aminoacyl-tRNA hydrolase [Clostridiales bacterium]|nr:aminoacyl-tRNA hydrolase [Clostridiales bacterium]
MFLRRSSGVKWLIVGLGNPGKKYENTRHNVGFQSVQYIAEKLKTKINRSKFHALTSVCDIENEKVMLMLPQTFMNESGIAVEEAASFYKINPENIIVIFDDISLNPGTIRIKSKGSSGGHNGLKSIQGMLDSEDYQRIKIGTGDRTDKESDLADWVLGQLTDSEKKLITDRFEDIFSSVKLMVSGNTEKAMNQYN